MSDSLPPEIRDLVIDQLCDESVTLKACCLASKSWIPRTRSHLFAHVEFDTLGSVRSWMEIFPDPSNSPAHHTRSLVISDLPTCIALGMDMDGCIRAFRNVEHLHLERSIWTSHPAALVPFFGFSPAVRSLRLTSTSLEVFDLICSFPLLEDLALVDLCPEDGTVNGRKAPSTSPKLTGSLDLGARGGIRSATRRLLDFPGGLRFAKITMECIGKDFGSATDLVSRCSGTLESLNIHCFLAGAFSSVSLIDQHLTIAH